MQAPPRDNGPVHPRRPELTDIEKLQRRLQAFADQRDWNQFHSPKNLAMALIVEAGELAEHFQWLTQEESFGLPADKLEEVGEELADIFVYLVRLSDQLGIDLPAAVDRKIELNEKKYPADLVRGSAKKYNEY
jgi:NTP pyrophosphatase (non-canonical NTP hydrolase)